jgi:hypothetical protein
VVCDQAGDPSAILDLIDDTNAFACDQVRHLARLLVVEELSIFVEDKPQNLAAHSFATTFDG